MSMAEPLMPHPEPSGTAFDEHDDAPVPEEHGEPEEADTTLTSAGRAAEGTDDARGAGGAAPLSRFPEQESGQD